MVNIKIVVSYDGGRFKGWQRLGDDDNTVQGKLEAVISKMVGRDIEIIGASRTDGGVHAYGQVASFKLDDLEFKKFTLKEIQSYLNRYLPEDISVVHISEVDERFHPRFNAKSKIYMYRICTSKYPDPMQRRYSTRQSNLDVLKMKAAAAYLLGEHDFTTYSNVRSKKKSMVKRIDRIDFTEDKSKDLLIIEIEGNSFLHNMIRRIVGTLIDIGRGRFEPIYAKEILEKKDRSLVGETASEKGLFLMRVNY